MELKRKRYVASIEIILDDDETQTQFGNLDLGNLARAQEAGEIVSWDYRDCESVHDVKPDGTVDFGEEENS